MDFAFGYLVSLATARAWPGNCPRRVQTHDKNCQYAYAQDDSLGFCQVQIPVCDTLSALEFALFCVEAYGGHIIPNERPAIQTHLADPV